MVEQPTRFAGSSTGRNRRAVGPSSRVALSRVFFQEDGANQDPNRLDTQLGGPGGWASLHNSRERGPPPGKLCGHVSPHDEDWGDSGVVSLVRGRGVGESMSPRLVPDVVPIARRLARGAELDLGDIASRLMLTSPSAYRLNLGRSLRFLAGRSRLGRTL